MFSETSSFVLKFKSGSKISKLAQKIQIWLKKFKSGSKNSNLAQKNSKLAQKFQIWLKKFKSGSKKSNLAQKKSKLAQIALWGVELASAPTQRKKFNFASQTQKQM